ncbi:PorP/SprF family type IX secretion system membrane protein [Mongoliitalea daihaiensis]|uniref:PorP/SprF family type IX secretion system membrane protein n=1 Tax=Mongoliitalea daihaiensis TaxID=2782006 RepID=UPI001F31A7B7|nr:type IX secretion system membrane protein PorP/SprF [Mongoliitalea daihaiensis]UJP65219.1 type IX secretion system membrane protein PorP/SprF [Mongoliitalea daihaiensis]
MKKLLIVIIYLGLTTSVFAQSRKYISQFSHLQSYYNPGLTGYEGSMIRGFVRNQWVGWEGAPMTYFISGELDFGELSGVSDPALLGKNALGVNMFHDQYGAFVETELILSYASRIQLTTEHNLRLGAGINYNLVQLDGTKFTIQESLDPILGQYANSFSDMQILDFNLGIALTHKDYYISTAVHNVNVGQINGGDAFMERKPRVLIFQAGYRSELTDNLMIATNVMYRGQNDLPDNIEVNFKVLMAKRIWLGGGHRFNYAHSFQVGLVLDRFRIGYIYEMPMLGAYLLPNTTHEFMVTYSLFGNGNGLMW